MLELDTQDYLAYRKNKIENVLKNYSYHQLSHLGGKLLILQHQDDTHISKGILDKIEAFINILPPITNNCTDIANKARESLDLGGVILNSNNPDTQFIGWGNHRILEIHTEEKVLGLDFTVNMNLYENTENIYCLGIIATDCSQLIQITSELYGGTWEELNEQFSTR